MIKNTLPNKSIAKIIKIIAIKIKKIKIIKIKIIATVQKLFN